MGIAGRLDNIPGKGAWIPSRVSPPRTHCRNSYSGSSWKIVETVSPSGVSVLDFSYIPPVHDFSASSSAPDFFL